MDYNEELDLLPEPYRTQVLGYFDINSYNKHKIKRGGYFGMVNTNLGGLLMYGFTWSETPERFEYWEKVFDYFNDEERYKELRRNKILKLL